MRWDEFPPTFPRAPDAHSRKPAHSLEQLRAGARHNSWWKQIYIVPTFPARGETNKRESASTFTFQIAEHALHDDVRSLRAGGARPKASECADLDGGPGAVGKLDTGAALSGGRSVGAHGGAGTEGREGVHESDVLVTVADGPGRGDGASSSGGLHFVLFRSRSERVPRLAFHFERGCCSFCTHACILCDVGDGACDAAVGGRWSRVLFRRGGCTQEQHCEGVKTYS
jgi:hypothetical protein